MKCEVIPGKNTTHHVKIYTLSTCGWCKKTKELLKALDVAYEYVDVDQLSGEDYTEATEEVKKSTRIVPIRQSLSIMGNM